jgi:hypothetical protein
MNEEKLPPEVAVERLKTEHLSKPRNVLPAKEDFVKEKIKKIGYIPIC